MKKLSIILITALIIISSCDSPVDLNPEGNSIAGYVVFADSNFIPGGYYTISLYPSLQNSFDSLPVRSDSLIITFGKYADSRYSSYFRMNGITEGRYFLACTWKPVIDSGYLKYPVCGTYGCDTSLSCVSHDEISFPNYEGVFRNIISWLDTSKSFN